MPSPRGLLKRATRRKITVSFTGPEFERLALELESAVDVPWWVRRSLSAYARWILLERAGPASAIAGAGPAPRRRKALKSKGSRSRKSMA